MIVVPCYMTAIRTFCYQINAVLIISVHILNPFCSLNDAEDYLNGLSCEKIVHIRQLKADSRFIRTYKWGDPPNFQVP